MTKLGIPTLLSRLKEQDGDRRWVPVKYESRHINTRKDGTKVYMYATVEEAHWLYPDGRKVYQESPYEVKKKWVMPEYTAPIKRRDIHNVIDEEIFKAIENLKHAKKRVVIRTVREALAESEYKEHLPKNVGSAVSRRIQILLDKRNLELVRETKHRTVLQKGKYKYVKG